MMKSLYVTLFLILLSTTVSQSQIVITEIMYNPPESGQDSLEFIELHNPKSSAIDISEYSITEGVELDFPDGTQIEANSYLVVSVSAASLNTVLGVNSIEWEAGALSNGGEVITIADALGNEVTSVKYGDGGDWPSEADGEGYSLEICDPTGSQSDPVNWSKSNTATGIEINGIEIYATPTIENTSTCLSGADYIVTVRNFEFDAADITIAVGETVLWNNVEGTHNVNGTQSTFPDNPESFMSGTPEAAPWTYSYTFNTAGKYKYQCDLHQTQMQGTVTVLSDLYPSYSIAEVTTVDADGVADSVNVKCSLTGIVETHNFRPGGLTFVMQESAESGINVFSDSESFNYKPKRGDEVLVKGTIDQFNGLTQIRVDSIEVLSEGNDIYGPVTVSEMNESNENTLITIEDVHIVDPSRWETGGSFNIDLTDGDDTLTMRIDESAGFDDMAPPEETFSVTGVVGQFDPTSPYLQGYQLLPRDPGDIDPYIISGPSYPKYSIAEVTTNNSQGVPDSIGVTCTLEGIVAKGNLDSDGYLFAMINTDNSEGITVYRFNKIGNYDPSHGDMVQVKGEISQYNGLTQIEIDSIELLSTDKNVEHEKVFDLNESMESRNVFLKDVQLVNFEPFSGDGTTTNVNLVTSDGDKYEMRITGAVPLSEVEIDPTGEPNNLNIFGVVGQYDTSEPYDDNYQIFPYSESDIILGFVSVDFVPEDISIEVYPNPAVNRLHLNSEIQVENIALYDSEGKLIQKDWVNARNYFININSLSGGTYNLVIKTDKGYAVRKFIKQD